MLFKKIISFCLFTLFISCSSGEIDIYDAARHGDLKTIHKVYEQDKESINTPNHRGHTPLILACYRNQPKAAELLLKLGANVNYKCDLGTALHAAVYQNNLSIAELLLKNKVKVNSVDNNKHTPLIMAVNGSDAKMVMLLLKYNADVTLVDKAGKTAFVHAMEQENEEISQLLRQ
ncbi:ankyrin repeat domain-containing protein [Wenyingzhuangia sp. IMCC45574]